VAHLEPREAKDEREEAADETEETESEEEALHVEGRAAALAAVAENLQSGLVTGG
jgi:hypothetical protein